MVSLRKNFKSGNVKLINFIYLRPAEKRIVRKLRNSEEIKRWMYSKDYISSEEHSRFIKKLNTDNKNFYWAAYHNNGECLGVIYLNRVDFRNKNAYLGMYANPYSDFFDKGEFLMKYLKMLAFVKFKLHTLKLEVISDNHKAINFYKKHGFKEEGLLKKFVFKNGEWKDVIIMGIINKFGNIAT